MTKEIRMECTACGATGVYQGFAEGRDEAVVCLECEGSGCKTLRYMPFTKRRRRKGVRIVRNSRGSFIATGVGGTGKAVTYQEFLAGKMPG